MKSGWWGQGAETAMFEQEFAQYTGASYAVAVNSGTMALKLAAKATGLVNGLVVCPALTFVSTALAMRQLGNKVIFADVLPDSLCLSGTAARRKFTEYESVPGPRGIVPVWYAGRVIPGEYENLPALTRIIEDCAHAAGSAGAGRQGRAAAWSFHAVKNLATGDGGMVTTDDEHVAREVKRLRWLGIDKSTWDRDTSRGYGWDYDISSLDGEKAHMNDITAAIGRAQLEMLEQRNESRRLIAAAYDKDLSGLPWLRLPFVQRDSSAHMYPVRVPAKERPRFIAHMLSEGVSAGVHYKPLTHYKDKKGQPLFGPQADLPVTEEAWKELVTIPLFPGMSTGEISQVTEAVRSFEI
jgi:perosamine synthetase